MSGKADDVLTDKFPDQKPFVVISREELRGYGPLGQRYNPDSLAKGGRGGLATYKSMRLDEQVKAVMNFKRDAIFARGWDFSYPATVRLSKEQQAERISVFQTLTDRMPGGFNDALNVIATGRDYGYSMTEKVYGHMPVEGREYVSIVTLLGRDPTTFIFNTDEYSQLKSCQQEVNSRKIKIDLAKFVHYVHAPEFDLYYGRSDLREAYKPWFWKSKMLDFWMLYGERLAGGVAVASIAAEANIASNSPVYKGLEDAMRNFRAMSGIILPPGVTLDIAQPASTDHYQKAVEFFDLGIAKSLLVPNLLGVSHTGQTGAYSQSQTQLEAFFWTLNSDKARLEACLNDQLFSDLGDQNWGDGAYPRFRFKELSSERLKWLIETWTKMVSGNVVVNTEEDERYLRSALQMPERSEEDVPLVTPNQKAEQEAQLAKADALRSGVEGTGAGAAKKNGEGKTLHERLDDLDKVLATIFERVPETKQLIVNKDMSAHKMSVALQRIHFSYIGEKQKDLSAEFAKNLGDFVARQVFALLGTDEQLATLIDTDLEDIAGIEFSGAAVGKLAALIKRALGSSWSLGESNARNELDRARMSYNRANPTDARNYQRVNMKSLKDRAAEYIGSKAFTMAGDLSDGTRKLIQNELMNAAKFGKTPFQARQAIWDLLVSRGMTQRERVRGIETDDAVLKALDELWVDSEDEAAAYLNTVARTTLFEAMNEARFAEFTDPELGDFVEGLEYSAVLDDRTTPICNELDGCKLSSTHPKWNELRPPNHFNCRSLLIPLTKFDGWTGVDDPIPNVKPAEGFK